MTIDINIPGIDINIPGWDYLSSHDQEEITKLSEFLDILAARKEYNELNCIVLTAQEQARMWQEIYDKVYNKTPI